MWVNEVGLVIHKKEEVKVVEEELVIEFKEETGEEIIMPNQNKENALLWFVSIIIKFINKIFKRSWRNLVFFYTVKCIFFQKIRG